MAFSVEQGENLRRLRNSPVCIICGRPGEAEAIAKALGIYGNRLKSHEIAEVHADHTFYYGEFTLQDGNPLGYVVTSSTRQGIQSFTVQAALLAHILRPKFLVHAGVCAAKKDGSIQIGDVILGESAFNFEEGKFKVVKSWWSSQVVFMPNYHQVSAHTGDMQAFASDSARPGYHYGDYITGSAVRGDAQVIFERISTQVGRDVIALDMEASAFLELCNYFLRETTCLGVVKGVSDFGDEHKDAKDKQKALESTANALKEWILHCIPVKRWKDDYSREPAAEIVPPYYDNFIKRVLDNVSQGLTVARKHIPGQNDHLTPIDATNIKGLKIIMPRDNNPIEYKELGPISGICKTHEVIEVEIGGVHNKRSLYYKAGYLIDWPRIVNRYSESYDSKHQVFVFGELLKQKEWFHRNRNGVSASIVAWDEFESWLESVRTPIIDDLEQKIVTPAVTVVERAPTPLAVVC